MTRRARKRDFRGGAISEFFNSIDVKRSSRNRGGRRRSCGESGLLDIAVTSLFLESAALSRHTREAVVADRAANAAVGGQPPLVTTAKREADNAQAFDQRARAGQTTPQQGMAGSSQRREASE
jgi:hypothetical protein